MLPFPGDVVRPVASPSNLLENILVEFVSRNGVIFHEPLSSLRRLELEAPEED